MRDAVERVVLSGHVGKSGAGLERVRLADGRTLVVKRIEPRTDITVEATGGMPGREYVLWRSGVLERLPAGVGHAMVDAWVEDGSTVLVMRDLGDAVLTWDDRLSPERAAWVMARVAALHRGSSARHRPTSYLLDRRSRSSPRQRPDLGRRGRRADALVLRGWELFVEEAPADVAGAVLTLLDDVTPLRLALQTGPVTMTHGDLATVNMAFEGDTSS